MSAFLFRFNEILTTSRKLISSVINGILLYVSLFAVLTILYEHGFNVQADWLIMLHVFQLFCLSLFGIGQVIRIFVEREKPRRWIDPVLGMLCLALVIFRVTVEMIDDFNIPDLYQQIPIHIFTFFIFIIELGRLSSSSRTISLNPSLLFVLSFLFLIGLGTLLLLLPRSTTEGISFVDSMFTATSAVCVTGLIVLDTAKDFTLFGQFIILFLIQLGGLGVMTFTTFFGYFFQGTSSLQSRLYMKDFLNQENVSQVVNTLIRIVLVTFGIEMIGAVFIWASVDASLFASTFDHIFFSIFHAVSAFCNAGFSTLSAGLNDAALDTNYNFQIIIAVLVIFGGLGFPIMFNYLTLYSHKINSYLRHLFFKEKIIHRTRILNINSRLAIYTTVVLLFGGWLVFYALEQDASMAGKDTWGKIATAFFGSVTPRTAGFNTVDMLEMRNFTILFYLVLMWIGASPGSTGGGIKTTTIAVAVINAMDVSKGRNRAEVFRREIAPESIKRAFAVIFLSLIVIALSAFLITFIEADKVNQPGLNFTELAVIFEAFSAYGTVGLSLGITPLLSSAGKAVIMFCMFMGRVGTLTILVGIVRKSSTHSYRYPRESIIIS